eukprot:CCRYP_014748-RA/>CCRYP_014748-RA protein AED:0.45 eAED:0.45 QI:0/0/0/1/0/0/2/0/231
MWFYGYPVKSTWIKAVKAGNFIGWPLLNTKYTSKYYPDNNETQKGHMTQASKNVHSTKKPHKGFELVNAASLQGKKEHEVFTTVYNIHNTIFSDQTNQFPSQLQRGNKHIMVMVEVDSKAILFKHMKSCKDSKMVRAYDALITCLMRNFKAHFLSVLVSVADSSPSVWYRLLPQTEIILNLLPQHQTFLHMLTFVDPLTTIRCLSLPWDARSNSTSPQEDNQMLHLVIPQP